MNLVSLRKNQSKFKASGKLLIRLRESIEHTLTNKNRKITTCNQRLGNTRISTDYAQKSHGTLLVTDEGSGDVVEGGFFHTDCCG